jgi:hypothetical protein
MKTICQMRLFPCGIDFFDSVTKRTYNVQVANSIGKQIDELEERQRREVLDGARSPR